MMLFMYDFEMVKECLTGHIKLHLQLGFEAY